MNISLQEVSWDVDILQSLEDNLADAEKFFDYVLFETSQLDEDDLYANVKPWVFPDKYAGDLSLATRIGKNSNFTSLPYKDLVMMLTNFPDHEYCLKVTDPLTGLEYDSDYKVILCDNKLALYIKNTGQTITQDDWVKMVKTQYLKDVQFNWYMMQPEDEDTVDD